MKGNNNLLTIHIFSYIKCSLVRQKKDRARQTLPRAVVHRAYHFIDFILFSHSAAVLRSWTHAGLGYLINNVSCHKPSVLNSFLFEDKCSCSDFSQLDFWQTFTQTEMQHLCIRFLTTTEGKGVRGRGRARGENRLSVGTNTYSVYCVYTCLFRKHTESELWWTFCSHTLWLAMNKSHLSTLFSDSLSRRVSKLNWAFLLETRERKSTQITQYNLYV